LLDPLRRALFSRLPIALVHHLSLYPAALLWGLLKLGLRPTEYFRVLARFGFAHLRSIVFDQMLLRIAHYWPRETVAELMVRRRPRSYPTRRGQRDVMVGDRNATTTAQ
jgi:hypothetical protein